MPMIKYEDAPDLCLLQFNVDNVYVSYLFDPGQFEVYRSIHSNFRPKRSPVHVAVLCAQLVLDRHGKFHYEVTNVKAIPGSNAGPFLYYVALQRGLQLIPDRSVTSPEAQRVWDSMDPRITRDQDGVRRLVDPTARIVDESGFTSNYTRFMQWWLKEHCDYPTREIIDAVLEGFAVIDIGRCNWPRKGGTIGPMEGRKDK